jgi:hypothetical protein
MNYAAAARFPDVSSLIRQARRIDGQQLEQVLVVAEEPSHRDIALPLLFE